MYYTYVNEIESNELYRKARIIQNPYYVFHIDNLTNNEIELAASISIELISLLKYTFSAELLCRIIPFDIRTINYIRQNKYISNELKEQAKKFHDFYWNL